MWQLVVQQNPKHVSGDFVIFDKNASYLILPEAAASRTVCEALVLAGSGF
jgi:hypothetical protein